MIHDIHSKENNRHVNGKDSCIQVTERINGVEAESLYLTPELSNQHSCIQQTTAYDSNVRVLSRYLRSGGCLTPQE